MKTEYAAYAEGRLAYREGRDESENPYLPVEDAVLYSAWVEGWADAYDEDR